MEAITLTINGNTISTRAGRTILEVAREQGIKIPTLCHHPFLRSIGACRVCQVEDEKRGVVVPACVTQVQEGMVISTDSPRVIRNRRNIVRLLLASHPESCVVCEKGNRCELRLLAAQLGVGEHGLDPMPYHPTVMDLNPFLTRDLSKCIMCAKCLRADQEVVVEGVIDYSMRGFDAHPATLFERPLEQAACTFCGTCLSVCPTGAIAEKDKFRLDHAGARTPSVCSFCACGCSIYVEHDYNFVRGISPTAREHTSNGISLCVKGHFGHDFLNNPDRLRTPLIKEDGAFRPASWDEALDLVAQRLGDIQQQHGPQALGFMGSARATNEENYLFQKLARVVFGTNNIDNASRVYWSQVARIIKEATGFAAGSASFRDLESSEVVMVIGADPTQTAPVMGYHLKRAAKLKQRKLILVDPLETKLVPFAHVWLRPQLAADLPLLAGMVKVLLEEDLVDHKFVASKTAGYEKFKERFRGVSVAQCARDAGVQEEDLRRASRILASGATASVVFGSGIMQQPAGSELVKLLLGLLLLTGNLGKEGAGLVPLLKDCNTQGAYDMGVTPDFLPGHKPLDDTTALSSFKEIWGTAPPVYKGLDSLQMVAAARQGAIKGLFVFCENPVAAMPRRETVAQALAGLSFLVVQDLFLTDTAKLAQVVLPAAGFPEKEGTVTNLERRVQRLNKAVLPPEDFPPEWQVLVRIARNRGISWEYGSPEDILKEIEKVVPLYRGMSEVNLEAGAAFWPLPGLEEVVDSIPHGIGRADGRALFPVPELGDGAGVPEEEGYPLVLIQGHLLQHLGSGSRTSRSRRLRKAAPHSFLGVSPADLKEMSLKEGDQVRVSSSCGSLQIPVKEDPRLPPGVLFIPASFPEVPHNSLFDCHWEQGKELTPVKYCRVKLEKV